MSLLETPFAVATGTYCIPTDYPVVADCPLWIYLVQSESGRAALIDCGVPTTYERVLAPALPALAVRPDQIEWLVLTHGHPDHMGGHPGLRARTPIRVAAPLEDVVWVESVERQWHDFWDCFPGSFSLEAEREQIVGMCGGDIRVDQILRDGDVFELDDRRLEVIQTRGHTRGHCALFERETGILFCGDDVQARGTPASSGTSVFAPLYDDVEDYLAGLERLRDLPFELLCPAHHLPLRADEGRAHIDASIAFVGEVDALVDGLLADTSAPLSTAQIAAAVGQLCGTDPPVSIQTMYTARAHLERAARAGRVVPHWAPARAQS